MTKVLMTKMNNTQCCCSNIFRAGSAVGMWESISLIPDRERC